MLNKYIPTNRILIAMYQECYKDKGIGRSLKTKKLKIESQTEVIIGT